MFKRRNLMKAVSICLTTVFAGGIFYSVPAEAQQESVDSGLLEITSEMKGECLIGDVNYDRNVTLEDATAILQYALAIDRSEETWDNMKLFQADYDGNGNVEVKDAGMALEEALKITNQKTVTTYGMNVVADICEEKEVQTGGYIECLKSKEELQSFIDTYADKAYGEKMWNSVLDYIEYKTPLYNNVDGVLIEEKDKERGVVAAVIPVHKSRRYHIDWIWNGEHLLLYVIEECPVDNDSEQYLSTYLTIMDDKLSDITISSYVGAFVEEAE